MVVLIYFHYRVGVVRFKANGKVISVYVFVSFNYNNVVVLMRVFFKLVNAVSNLERVIICSFSGNFSFLVSKAREVGNGVFILDILQARF